jgi:hypothetical protein
VIAHFFSKDAKRFTNFLLKKLDNHNNRLQELTISLAKMLVFIDPRSISRTNIVKICVRYISTRFLIIRFHISGECSSENSFLCLLKSCAKNSWTYLTLCARYNTVKAILWKTGIWWKVWLNLVKVWLISCSFWNSSNLSLKFLNQWKKINTSVQ